VSVYKKRTQYDFEVNGFQLSIVDFSDHWCDVEETTKNGQEDTHMRGLFVRDDITEPWKPDVEECESLVDYGDDDLPEAIAKFLNEHGLPGIANTENLGE